jgi:hypothetical protein
LPCLLLFIQSIFNQYSTILCKNFYVSELNKAGYTIEGSIEWDVFKSRDLRTLVGGYGGCGSAPLKDFNSRRERRSKSGP